jgi:hypothetical protein
MELRHPSRAEQPLVRFACSFATCGFFVCSLQLLLQLFSLPSVHMSRKPAVPDLFGVESDDEDHPKHKHTGAGHNANTG